MGDHFVESHYIAPDFDPTALGKGKGTVAAGYRQRMQLPCGVVCSSCNQLMPAGAKLYMEKVRTDRDYLGIKIWKLHFRCLECLNTLTFETSPKDSAYKLISGGTAIVSAKMVDKKAQMNDWAKDAKEAGEDGALDKLRKRVDSAEERMAQADELASIAACVRGGEIAQRALAPAGSAAATSVKLSGVVKAEPARTTGGVEGDAKTDMMGGALKAPDGRSFKGRGAVGGDGAARGSTAAAVKRKRSAAEDDDVGLGMPSASKKRR